MWGNNLRSGLLRGLSQLVAAAMLAASLTLIPATVPAIAVQPNGSDSEVDYALDGPGTGSSGFYSEGNQILPAAGDFTVEAWVKPDSLPNKWNQVVHNFNGYNYQRFDINIGAGVVGSDQIQILYNPEAPNNTDDMVNLTPEGFRAPVGQWTHIAVSVDVTGDQYVVSYFLNGRLFGTHTQQTVTFGSMANNIYVGYAVIGVDSRTIDGQIDQVKIWNSALNVTQVGESMHKLGSAGVSGNPSLRHHYDFNEGSGSIVYDRAGSRNLTQLGSPTRVDVKRVISTTNGETIITFPRTYLPGIGGWRAPESSSHAGLRILAVAGGGSGGSRHGGGGGAGALAIGSGVQLSGVIPIQIGQGGLAAKANTNTDGAVGTSGQATVFGNLVLAGGGRGTAGGNNGGVAESGGSGGGTAAGNTYPAPAAVAQSTLSYGLTAQGNQGAFGFSGNADNWAGGGGGGAGSAGSPSSANSNGGGAGGSGVSSDITGTTVCYAAGGGGGLGGASSATAGAGGSCVSGGTSGGAGTKGNVAATSGVTGTGSGGGGAGYVAGDAAASGAGGSGLVVVRYASQVDMAWSKSATSGNYASSNTQIVPSSGDWSFEAWIWPNAEMLSGTGLYGIFTQQTDSDNEQNRAGLWVTAGSIGYNYGGTTFTRSEVVLDSSRWYHVALTQTANSQKLYVDGHLFQSTTFTRETVGGNFTLGGLRQSNFLEWSGQLDQVKVWVGELTQEQVQTSMHTYSSSGITGKTLRAHYDFNEYQFGSLLDRSGNNYHLPFNLSASGNYESSDLTSSRIVEEGSPTASTRSVKFNRTYLTSVGGWTPVAGISRYDALVVGGGGGGGAWVGGGGGAGGLTLSNAVTLGGVTSIKVGQGGFPAIFDPGVFAQVGLKQKPANGQTSSVGISIEVRGGGFGGSHTGNPILQGAIPSVGGSGGGGTGRGNSSVYNQAYLGASGAPGQGFSGGNGFSTAWIAAGGGGAGGAGLSATSTQAGNGGPGFLSSITGTPTYYAGGGGGGFYGNPSGQGVGGVGGGGNAGYDTTAGGPGLTGTGGGGGGGASSATTFSKGGPGGSGIVILSYSLAPDAPTSLVATQSTSHATVNLTWAAPTYVGDSALTDYEIEYKPEGGSWTSFSDSVSTGTTGTVVLPQQCVAHEFRVFAKNAGYRSAASATVSATPVWGSFGSLTGVQVGVTNSECVVSFTAAGTNSWTPPVATDFVQALVVAGGGGGGGTHAGGGGAGGLAISSKLPVSGTLPVAVGGGGLGFAQSNIATCDPNKVSNRGQDSRLGDVTVSGGGHGSNGCGGTQNTTGGSGGGGSYSSTDAGNNRGLSSLSPNTVAVSYFGNNGSFGAYLGGVNDLYMGGGGGGAGSAAAAPVAPTAGAGGSGFRSTISGTLVCYAAGGGGGAGTAQSGAGGPGGTCAGMSSPAGAGGSGTNPGTNAVSNTGSGGGGGGYTDTAPDKAYPAGNGASGIVIIRQLSVNTPVISQQPANSSVQPGNSATITVTASGNGTLSYQWQISTDGSNWSNVGNNSSTYTSPSLLLSDDGVRYRVSVTNTLNGQTSQLTSNVAVVSVTGVTITAGACSAMVGNSSGVTISETANGACLVEYKSPGNNSFYVPSLVSSIQAYIVGGGGGGGGANRTQGGGGGGSGAASRLLTLPVTASQMIPLSVGAGGAGGAALSNGSDGGATSISTSYSVPGGRGGKAPTNWPGGAGEGGSGPSGDLYATSGASGGNGVRDPGDRSYYQPKFGNAGSSRTFAGKFWCVGGGGGGGNREVANDPYFHWEPRSQFCSDGVTKSGGSGGWHNGTTNLLPTAGLTNSGGGGGGGSYNSTTNRAGGNGADGIVAIYFVPGTGNISLSSLAAVSYSGTTHAVTLTKDNPTTTVTWTTSNAAVCTVTGTHTGATVTEVAAGLCEVSVVVAASSPYARGTSAVTFRIDKITRTAPIWTNNSATVPFGGTIDLRLKLSSPGSNAYTFSTSGTAGSCSVTGYTLNVGNVGDTCNVTPTLVGDSIYADVQGSQALSVTVTRISQSALVITSGTATNVNQVLNVSAAGGSGTGALSYHVANQGTTGCTINSSTGELTAATAGSCEVYAQRAQSTNYDAITSSHVVVAVSKISQNLTWVSQPQARYLPGNTYALEATASSQLAVAYSISAGLCTLSGSTVTFTGSGDCVIHAGQPGDGSYFAAVTISQTVSVGKINQTMTFSALANKSWGSLAFSLSATASSGLAVAYSENNQTTNDACDVSNNGIVTIKNVGSCAITALQSGDASYTSVTATRIFEVTANQAGAPFIGSVSFGDRKLNASFFTPSYLGGGTISAYELRAYKLDGTLASTNTGCVPNAGATQSCSVIGLDNGTKYVLRVAAITQAGLGQLSASSSEIIPASNPEAVGNLIAIEGNGSLSLQWTQPTSFGGGSFFQYRIYWRAPGQQYQPDGSPGATVGNQASRSYVITGLVNGVSYDVKIVTATSNNNVELQSNTAEVRQTPYTVPDAPAAVVALDNVNTFKVAWQPPTFDGGNAIDQYVVQKDGVTVCTINNASSTSCEVPKPSPGTTAVIGVRAGNDAGLSAPASTAITVQALPSSLPALGGGSGSSGGTQINTPSVTSVSGSSKVQLGELVRMVGTGLNKVQKVTIGGIETGFILTTTGVLQVRVPEGLGLGRVAVTFYGDFGVAIFSDLLEIVKTEIVVQPKSKVSIGSYLGRVAIYTLNHQGKRLSIRIGNRWQVIDPLTSNFTETLSKSVRGETVVVSVYIDRQLIETRLLKIR